MDFVAVVDQVIALLRQRGRVAYRTLKRQFQLDDEALEDLKIELIDSQRLATDEQGTVLVWTGVAAAPPVAPADSLGTVGGQPPLRYTPGYLAEKILTSKTTLEGERKQVTVLFADLKDSTELIRGLDPEAAQQLLDPAIHLMMDAVHRFEGTVNQVLGDGIVALFGAPIAHEDHALRACYAALAMQAAMQPTTEEVRRTRGLELRMRVGLNSGEVVVRAIGNDLHMDYSVVGEAGVGKSRLAYEFVHAHPTQGWLVLESASVSYGKATPYFPVIDLLKRYCHVEEQDEARTVRAKVTGQVLTLDEALQDTIPALLSLLEMLPEDSPFRTLDPPH